MKGHVQLPAKLFTELFSPVAVVLIVSLTMMKIAGAHIPRKLRQQPQEGRRVHPSRQRYKNFLVLQAVLLEDLPDLMFQINACLRQESPRAPQGHRLDVDKLHDTESAQFTAIAGVLDSAKGNARI